MDCCLRTLVGDSPWSHKESDTTEWLHIRDYGPVILNMGLLRWLSGKESACQFKRCRRRGFDPWVRKIPGEGNGNPLQYSCLDNTMEEPGGLQSMVSQRVRHNWVTEGAILNIIPNHYWPFYERYTVLTCTVSFKHCECLKRVILFIWI